MQFSIRAFIGCLMLGSATLQAQSLAERVAAIDGTVRLAYQTKPGVCGDGHGHITTSGRSWSRNGDGYCEPGPARLSLTVSGGRVIDADLEVGGRWRTANATLDWGNVEAADAAEAMLILAASASDRAGGRLIMAAAVADSAVVWPELIRLARSPTVPEETRDDAVLWLGFAASDVLGPDEDAGEDDVRESAIFALSQRPTREAVPALTRVVESDLPVRLRKNALFWLGQTDRDRAVEVSQAILEGS